MTDFLKAAADARRLLAGFKAIDQVAAAFENVGSLQQAMTEAQVALSELRAEVETTKAHRAQLHADRDHAQKAAQSVLMQAEEAARAQREAASQEAAAIVDAAHLQADDIVAQAEAERKKAMEAAEAALEQVKAVQAETRALEARAEKARAYINKLKD